MFGLSTLAYGTQPVSAVPHLDGGAGVVNHYDPPPPFGWCSFPCHEQAGSTACWRLEHPDVAALNRDRWWRRLAVREILHLRERSRARLAAMAVVQRAEGTDAAGHAFYSSPDRTAELLQGSSVEVSALLVVRRAYAAVGRPSMR